MGLELDSIDGQTPLDEEEKDGLLIPTIATRGELDEFEQQNIEAVKAADQGDYRLLLAFVRSWNWSGRGDTLHVFHTCLQAVEEGYAWRYCRADTIRSHREW